MGAPPSAQRLQTYAEGHGLDWKWKVVPEGECWRAHVSLGNFGTNGLGDGPQEALDRCIESVIRYIEHPPISHQPPINMRFGR